MKIFKQLLIATMAVVVLSTVCSCGDDDPILDPQRPGTENNDNGNNNTGNDNNENNNDNDNDNGNVGDNEDNKGEQEKPYIPVSSITLSEKTMTLKVGEVKPLVATVLPANANQKKGHWYIKYYGANQIAETVIVVSTDPADSNIETKHIKGLYPGTAWVEVEVIEGDQKIVTRCDIIVEKE